MKKTIQYAILQNTGQVVSRQGDTFQWPILNYDAMRPENNFQTSYTYQRVHLNDLILSGEINQLKYTRKLPIEVKNQQRQLWGLKPLVPKPPKVGRQPRPHVRARRSKRLTRRVG